jgi:hypothetical protein
VQIQRWWSSRIESPRRDALAWSFQPGNIVERRRRSAIQAQLDTRLNGSLRCSSLTEVLDTAQELDPLSDFGDAHLLETRHVHIEQDIPINVVPLEKRSVVPAFVDRQPLRDFRMSPALEVLGECKARRRAE